MTPSTSIPETPGLLLSGEYGNAQLLPESYETWRLPALTWPGLRCFPASSATRGTARW